MWRVRGRTLSRSLCVIKNINEMAIEEPKYKCPMQSAFFTLKLAAAAKSKNPKIKKNERRKRQNTFYTNFPPMKVFPFHYFSARVYRIC